MKKITILITFILYTFLLLSFTTSVLVEDRFSLNGWAKLVRVGNNITLQPFITTKKLKIKCDTVTFIGGSDYTKKSYPWTLANFGSSYAELKGKYMIGSTFYSSDSLDILNLNSTTNNYFVGQGGKRTTTGTGNIVIGDVTAGDALTSSNNNIIIGTGSGSSIAALTGSNIFIGPYSGAITSSSSNVFIGPSAGRYITTRNFRIIFDNRQRSNELGDTTLSSIFINTATTTANQDIYLNGNTNISNNLTVSGWFNYGADAESSDTYVVTIPRLKTLTVGQIIIFSAKTANTGACSLNVNAFGAKPLKVLHDQDPPDNYIEQNSMIVGIYDGTNIQVISPDSNP